MSFFPDKQKYDQIESRLSEIELHCFRCDDKHKTHELHRRASDSAAQMILESQKIMCSNIQRISDIIEMYLPHLKTISEIEITARTLKKTFALVYSLIIATSALMAVGAHYYL